MGATRTDHYTARQNEMAVMLKAMAHPARIAILEYLLKVDSCVCGAIVDEIPLAQPTVSQHLKELKAAGLIEGDVTGNSVCYCINEKNWNKLHSLTDKFFGKFKGSACKC